MRRHTPHSLRRDREGFSLVELMMVALILAITSAGVLNMVVESFKMNGIARENLSLREGIDGVIDELRARSWTAISALANNNGTEQFVIPGLIAQNQRADTADPADDPFYHQGVLNNGSIGRFTVEWDDLQIDENVGAETVARVRVQVWWRGVIGNRYKEEFVMLVEEG